MAVLAATSLLANLVALYCLFGIEAMDGLVLAALFLLLLGLALMRVASSMQDQELAKQMEERRQELMADLIRRFHQ